MGVEDLECFAPTVVPTPTGCQMKAFLLFKIADGSVIRPFPFAVVLPSWTPCNAVLKKRNKTPEAHMHSR